MIPPRLAPLLDPGEMPSRLAVLFAEAGFELYLVGGSVRDLLLGRQAADYDFATDARPEDIKKVIAGVADAVYDVGESFGTIGFRRSRHTYEVTTYRSEAYRGDSRKPLVAFSDDIAEDLSRRDFTVNAMALRLPDPVMVDPFGGLTDLAEHVLRTPLSPEISFGDDPLRMLRLFRFMSQLGFSGDPGAVSAVAEMAGRLGVVSAERIRDELVRLLVGPHVEEALTAVVDTGLAAEFMPEVADLALARDPMHRHKDVLAHTIAVVGKISPVKTLRLAALFHDVGKPATRAYGPEGVTFHHHEVVGARLARERLRALRFSKDIVAGVSRLVFLHMRPHTYKMGWTDRAVRRYVRDAGPLLLELNELVRSDVTTRNPKRERAISSRIDELERRIDELRLQEELDRIRPPVNGHDVMAHLGIGPGPAVGRAMEMLLEKRLDEGPFSVEEAYRVLDEWAAGRAPGGE